MSEATFDKFVSILQQSIGPGSIWSVEEREEDQEEGFRVATLTDSFGDDISFVFKDGTLVHINGFQLGNRIASWC